MKGIERIKGELSVFTAPAVASIALLGIVGSMALEFSQKTREVIKSRAEYASELDPRMHSKFFKLQAMHKDHRRFIKGEPNEMYNDPDNGLLGTVAQHHANLIGGLYNKDGSVNEGGVDHSIFFRPELYHHFTDSAISMFIKKYGSDIRLWNFIPPKWSQEGRAEGDLLGTIARPATFTERHDGICRIEVPLILNKKEEPSERIRIITFKDIHSGKAQEFRRII
jgi:hypothetical protein